MNANFMASHVFFNQYGGVLNNTRTNDEESRGEILLMQIIENISNEVNLLAEDRAYFTSSAHGAEQNCVRKEDT